MRKIQGAKPKSSESMLGYVTEADDEVHAKQVSQATQHLVHYDTTALLGYLVSSSDAQVASSCTDQVYLEASSSS